MIKKILPIITIVLAVGLIVFLGVVSAQEGKRAKREEKIYEKRQPYAVQQEELEQQLKDLQTEYEKSLAPNALVEILFTELDAQVYDLCYPIMKEYEYIGTLALSPREMPGQEGCMSIEQFQELMDAGWKTCITWQSDKPLNRWWPQFAKSLSDLGIEQSQIAYFPKGAYKPEVDGNIQGLGFNAAVSNVVDEDSPLQLQYEEGIWHVGAVGMMSPKPRLWLREAVAQYANLIFLVGFDVEDQKYNENSFRSMLKALDEYEATGELVITSVSGARNTYHQRSLGGDPVLEKQYQERKEDLEQRIKEVKKQLEEIDAMY